MTDKHIEFGVDTVEHDGSVVIVSGRCYKGPITLGDCFNLVYKLKTLKGSDGSYGPSLPFNKEQLSLCVEKIWSYGHTLDTMDEGLTGKLQLSGWKGRVLQHRDVLGRYFEEEVPE
jgi:hypothetical protein